MSTSRPTPTRYPHPLPHHDLGDSGEVRVGDERARWVWHGLDAAFSMFWETPWALVLGFALFGAVQAFVSRGERKPSVTTGRRTWASVNGHPLCDCATPCTLGSARGSSCVEVSPAAFRTVGEPGFALSARLYTARTSSMSERTSWRHVPPRDQHQAIASGIHNSSSAAPRWCS